MSTECLYSTLDPTESYTYSLFVNYCRALQGNTYWVINGEDRNLFLGWHHELQTKHRLHPSVEYLVQRNCVPENFKQLVLEWPHVAESDETRLAYTRNIKDGAVNRQLITSIGKYLSRHFPSVADHIRRDAAAYHTIDRRVIVDTTPDIIRTVEVGPRSCMASIHGSIPWKTPQTEQMGRWYRDETLPPPDWTQHPYWCYDPALGWSMAQRWSQQGDEMRLDGRALIYKKPGSEDKPVFVRTYARNKADPVAGWSETDFALHTWLEKQGHVKVDSWPFGAEIRTRKHDQVEEYFAPYVDGTFGAGIVNEDGTKLVLVDPTDDTGDYFHELRNTHGWSTKVRRRSVDDEYNEGDDDDDMFYCEHCDEYTHNDHGYWAGRYEDYHICENCRDSHYMWVNGAGNHGHTIEYLVHSDNAVCVAEGDEYVDINNLPRSVVRLYDYTYDYRDDCVEIEGAWYRTDCEHVCYLDAGKSANEWVLAEDSVFTEDTGHHILESEAFEVDGLYYEHKPEEVTTAELLTQPIKTDADHVEEEEIQ